MPEASPLTPKLRQAGAVIGTRHGRSVAIHFGSAAGELAACLRGVGLVERSDLGLLGVEAPPDRLDDVIARLAGAPLSVGGVAAVGDGWWCRVADREALVVCPLDVAPRRMRQLHDESHRTTGLAVRDRSGELSAIGVVGRATPRLLAALGAYGEHADPRRVRPLAPGRLADAEILWLLQSDESALALVAPDAVRAAWDAIDQAGREFGLSYVGTEAAARLSVAAALRARSAAATA